MAIKTLKLVPKQRNPIITFSLRIILIKTYIQLLKEFLTLLEIKEMDEFDKKLTNRTKLKTKHNVHREYQIIQHAQNNKKRMTERA